MDVEAGGDSSIAPRSGNSQAVVGDVAGFAGDLELEVELAQLKVLRGDVGDQRSDHAAARLLGPKVLRARGLGQAAEATEKVHLPIDVEAGLRVAGVQTGGHRNESVRADLRNLVGIET